MQIKEINKRAVLIQWKNRSTNSIELFSSLKNLCLSYPQYNYNTISNYLSKDKIAYENAEVKIERKIIYSRPIQPPIQRSVKPVVVKKALRDTDEKQQDLNYWLQQPAAARLRAVTFIIAQSLRRGQQLDKTQLSKRKLK